MDKSHLSSDRQATPGIWSAFPGSPVPHFELADGGGEKRRKEEPQTPKAKPQREAHLFRIPPDSDMAEDTKIKMSWNQPLETSRAIKKQGL